MSWYSGLGNNIIQLIQVEYLAEQAGFTVHVPPHNIMKLENKYLMHDIKPMPLEQRPYFPKTSSSLFFDLRKKPDSFAGSKLALFRSFYFRFDMQSFSPRLGDYRRILRRELLPVLPYHDDHLINDETLVIHMRSGDVFGDDLSEIPKGYIQPPLSYYLEIINKFGFKDIVIVTEKDLRNPCIKQLKELMPDLKIQTSNLLDDMSTIMSARNLIVVKVLSHYVLASHQTKSSVYLFLNSILQIGSSTREDILRQIYTDTFLILVGASCQRISL